MGEQTRVYLSAWQPWLQISTGGLESYLNQVRRTLVKKKKSEECGFESTNYYMSAWKAGDKAISYRTTPLEKSSVAPSRSGLL